MAKNGGGPNDQTFDFARSRNLVALLQATSQEKRKNPPHAGIARKSREHPRQSTLACNITLLMAAKGMLRN